LRALPGLDARESRRLVAVLLRRRRLRGTELRPPPLPHRWLRCWRHQLWWAWLTLLLDQPLLTLPGSLAVPAYALWMVGRWLLGLLA